MPGAHNDDGHITAAYDIFSDASHKETLKPSPTVRPDCDEIDLMPGRCLKERF